MTDVSTATVTFLFSDIEGSTRLLNELGDAYGAVLAEHQRLLREAFDRHGGREVDTQGDAFFVAFPRARDAVLAAVDAQRALAKHQWPGGAEVRVRIGIHTGGAALAEDRYVGIAVHRANRIATAAHGGQILLSETTERLLEEEGLDGVGLRDLGTRRLKDIDRPVRIFQVEAPDLRRDFPALKTLDVQRGRRRLLIAAAVAPAVVLAAVLVAVVGRGDPGIDAQPNSVAVIDARTADVVAAVPVGASPTAVAAGAGSIWVANADAETVQRIDPRTRRVVATFPLGATPTGIAFGEGAVWVAHGLLGTLTRIDPAIGPAEPTAVADRAQNASVAAGAGSIWYASADSTIAEVDPALERAPRRGCCAGGIPVGLTVAEDGFVWTANSGDNTVSRVSPRTLSSVGSFPVGRQPAAIAAGGGGVWIANLLDDTVTRIDVRSSSQETVRGVGDGPAGIAYGDGAVWVANATDGTVSRVDPESREVTATVEIGNRPAAVVASGGAVWVAVRAP